MPQCPSLRNAVLISKIALWKVIFKRGWKAVPESGKQKYSNPQRL